MDLIGRERVGDFVAENADETSPGDALFFAQGGAYVRQQQKSVRDAALAKLAGVNHPARGGAREPDCRRDLNHVFAGVAEEHFELEFFGGSAEIAGGVEFEEPLGGGIDEAQASGLIEGKNGRVEFGDDAAEEGGGLKRAETLGLVHVGEGIDFDGEVAEGVVDSGSAGAEGVVLFAQRSDYVGEGLERADDLIHEGRDGSNSTSATRMRMLAMAVAERCSMMSSAASRPRMGAQSSAP